MTEEARFPPNAPLSASPNGENRINGENREPVFTYPVETARGTYQLLRVRADDAFARKLIPQIIRRAIEFIARTNSETDELWLGNLLYSNFYQNTNYIHVLAALDAEGQIVAHSITYVENFQKLGYHAHILQVEKNPGVGSEVVELGMKLIVEWAKSLGLKTILNSAATQSRQRLFGRYGFEPYRYITRKEIE